MLCFGASHRVLWWYSRRYLLLKMGVHVVFAWSCEDGVGARLSPMEDGSKMPERTEGYGRLEQASVLKLQIMIRLGGFCGLTCTEGHKKES